MSGRKDGLTFLRLGLWLGFDELHCIHLFNTHISWFSGRWAVGIAFGIWTLGIESSKRRIADIS